MREETKVILEQLRRHEPMLRQEFPIRRLALFGSYARDEANAESDVDILVEADPSIGLEFVTLAERLEGLLGKKVDLISRRAIKPSLWLQVEPDLLDV